MKFKKQYCIKWLFLITIFILILTVPSWSHRVKNYSTNSPKNTVEKSPKDLREMNKHDKKLFFNSFDTVITDLDGTLWQGKIPITGAIKSLKKLRKCGKKIIFLTNSIGYPKENLRTKLLALTYNSSLSDIITPVDSVAWYLKDIIKLNGTVFVIGTKNFITQLTRIGIDVLVGPSKISEGSHVVESLTNLNKNIQAVIFDFDINVNYIKIMQAAQYIKQQDVIYLMGTPDKTINVNENLTLIGSAPFADILSHHVGKRPKLYSKPSEIMRDYLINNHNINNPENILMIGDSLQSDMKFGDLCGFKKLWVGSGPDKSQSCDNGCEGSPNYYLPDLGKMPKCIL